MLFVPGTRPDRFGKAVAAGADGVILDLEDAVAEQEKVTARQQVAQWLADGGRAAVRLNPAGTAWHEEDLAALRGAPGLVAVIVPKAEDPAVLERVGRVLDRPVLAIVESAVGLHRVHEVAGAEPVARLAFGHLDYAQDLGCSPTREAVAHARSTVVLASRVAGLAPPMDGVTTDLEHEEATEEDTRYALAMGFSGKLLIHPRQVAPTHRALAPTQVEVDWASRVLEVAQAGVGRVDGGMVDAPVIAQAQRVLDRHRAATAAEG